MTLYTNPKIPEGINITDEHPLKDFLAMLIGVGLIILVLILVLSFLAETLVRFVPFEVERQLAESALAWPDLENPPDVLQRGKNEKATTALQALTESLAQAQRVDLPLTVHFLDSEAVNAFATLGGHIFVTRGLLEKMPNENALAMVLAHEIAHVSHRDPIIALGRGLTVGLALMSTIGAGHGAMAQQMVGQVNLLTHLSFSRKAESAADAAALHTLLSHYGNVRAAETLFTLLQDNSLAPPEFFSTHPLNQHRIEAIKQFSLAHSNHHSDSTKPVPLSPDLQILPKQSSAVKAIDSP